LTYDNSGFHLADGPHIEPPVHGLSASVPRSVTTTTTTNTTPGGTTTTTTSTTSTF